MSIDLTQYAYVGDVIALACKMKNVLASAINSLLPESSLDNSKSVIVSNFAFNSTAYPGATDPNLNGKPVLVLAVKTIDHTNNNAETIAYSFLNLAPLVVDISGKVDKLQGVNPNNIPMFDANGNLQDSGIPKTNVALKANNPTNGHVAGVDADGNPTDTGIVANTVLTSANVATTAETTELITAIFGS